MFVYFIPLTVNLTKNSKLEKFVHELNALWKLTGSSMRALRELNRVAGILACSLHICDYMAVGSLYGITLLMLSPTEMPGLNSILKVPFTCVCRTLYVPPVHLPNLRVIHCFFCTLC
jgi:hypothetical protein